MSHDKLREALLWAMGGKVHPGARETWGKFLSIRATEFFINYDWVQRKEFYTRLWTQEPRVFDFGDGAQGLTVFCIEKEKQM